MRVEEVFRSAGATPRSHNLASSTKLSAVVYASGHFLVVESVPSSSIDFGKALCVSECHHSKPITVVKRAKSVSQNEIFVSGGADGKINLWKLHGTQLLHLTAIEIGDCSIISVCAAVREKDIVIIASWGDELCGNLKAFWLEGEHNLLRIAKKSDMKEMLSNRSFILAMDCNIFTNDHLLLAVGTSLRKVEIFYEQDGHFSKRISVVGHTDWIHSIAFNDRKDNLLIASAGQDTFIKVWKIAYRSSNIDDAELSVTKNNFTIDNGKGELLQLTFNVEAVISGHEDWIHSTEWSLNGKKLVTASSDKTVIVWEETENIWTDTVRLGIIGGQAAGFFAAVFTADSVAVVATAYFGGLHCWREQEESVAWSAVTMCGGHVGEVRDICWSPEGHYFLTVGKDQTTRLFVPEKITKKFIEIARPQVHGHDMQCIISVSNSCFVSGAEEKIFRAFRAPETFANSLCSISGYEKEKLFANQILENFGARLPALGLSNKTIEEGNSTDEEQHWEEAAFQANPENLSKPPCEDYLQQSTLWPELQKLYGHGFEVYAVACNPSGTVLATACKASHSEHSQIILWEISTWSKKNTIPGHQLTVTQIEWSPDGRYLLSVSRDRTAIIYQELQSDLNGFDYQKFWSSGKEHSRIIWSCCWLEDSKSFITVSRDQKMILWQAEYTKAVVLSSTKLSLPITAVTAGRNTFNKIIACGLQNGSVSLFSLDGNQFVPRLNLFTPIVTVDSAVSRLRFDVHNETAFLGYAGTNGITRVIQILL